MLESEAMTMLTAVEGIFREGRIELRETPENIREARVIVTFLIEEQPWVAPGTLGEEPRMAAAPATAAERVRALRELLDSLPAAPTLPLEAFDRQNIYS